MEEKKFKRDDNNPTKQKKHREFNTTGEKRIRFRFNRKIRRKIDLEIGKET